MALHLIQRIIPIVIFASASLLIPDLSPAAPQTYNVNRLDENRGFDFSGAVVHAVNYGGESSFSDVAVQGIVHRASLDGAARIDFNGPFGGLGTAALTPEANQLIQQIAGCQSPLNLEVSGLEPGKGYLLQVYYPVTNAGRTVSMNVEGHSSGDLFTTGESDSPRVIQYRWVANDETMQASIISSGGDGNAFVSGYSILEIGAANATNPGNNAVAMTVDNGGNNANISIFSNGQRKFAVRAGEVISVTVAAGEVLTFDTGGVQRNYTVPSRNSIFLDAAALLAGGGPMQQQVPQPLPTDNSRAPREGFNGRWIHRYQDGSTDTLLLIAGGGRRPRQWQMYSINAQGNETFRRSGRDYTRRIGDDGVLRLTLLGDNGAGSQGFEVRWQEEEIVQLVRLNQDGNWTDYQKLFYRDR